MSEKEASQKTQELLGKVPSKPMTLGDWRRWWLKVEDSDVVDAFNVKLISVEGLVDEVTKLKDPPCSAFGPHGAFVVTGWNQAIDMVLARLGVEAKRK